MTIRTYIVTDDQGYDIEVMAAGADQAMKVFEYANPKKKAISAVEKHDKKRKK